MGQAWKTTVVAVLLCTLAVGSAKAREPHRDLHGSQKSVAVADGRLKNTDGKTYFVVRASQYPSFALHIPVVQSDACLGIALSLK